MNENFVSVDGGDRNKTSRFDERRGYDIYKANLPSSFFLLSVVLPSAVQSKSGVR